jgi:flagellar secretion chaperone FliS
MMYGSPTSLSPGRGAAMYARLGLDTAALSASPHQLIAMLFEGAAGAIAMARLHVEQGNIPAKGAAISKAIAIVDSGLKASLDSAAGGAPGAQLSSNLSQLYDYVVRRLMFANLHNNTAALDESARLLDSIGSAWREIAPAPVAGGPSREVDHG